MYLCTRTHLVMYIYTYVYMHIHIYVRESDVNVYACVWPRRSYMNLHMHMHMPINVGSMLGHCFIHACIHALLVYVRALSMCSDAECCRSPSATVHRFYSIHVHTNIYAYMHGFYTSMLCPCVLKQSAAGRLPQSRARPLRLDEESRVWARHRMLVGFHIRGCTFPCACVILWLCSGMRPCMYVMYACMRAHSVHETSRVCVCGTCVVITPRAICRVVNVQRTRGGRVLMLWQTDRQT